MLCLCRALHPTWAAGTACTPGVAGMRAVFVRLGEGLEECGLTSYVAHMFVRAWDKRTTGEGKSYTYSWGEVRASEHEAVCRMLPFCVQGLITPELTKLSKSARKPDDVNLPLGDPTTAVTLALGQMLNWYLQMRTPSMTAGQIEACRERGDQLIHIIVSMFPERNTDPTAIIKGDSASPHASPRHDDGTDTGEESVDDEEAGSSEDTTTNHPKHTRSWGVWDVPKVHACKHCPDSIYMYGDWDTCATCALEHHHVLVKKGAAMSNQRREWLLQVLVRDKTMRTDSSQDINDLMTADEFSDLPELPAPEVSERMARNTSFAGNAGAAGMNYPLITALASWRELRRAFGQQFFTPPKTGITMGLRLLGTPDSYWVLQNPEFKELPFFVAEYLRLKYHGRVHGLSLPAPGEDKLTATVIWELLGMLRASPKSETPASIAPFKNINIKHPRIHGQVHGVHKSLSQCCHCCRKFVFMCHHAKDQHTCVSMLL